ncbi:hypothetical protein AURDEDRAFT_173171 [Auricularia subglabra TFB-10046 SS5]|nr:hypothetical protein AURDEDRAFT_173171 [Auricularia subglabra TFB-10046 SS5]
MLLPGSTPRGQSTRARGLERILTSCSACLDVRATGSPTRQISAAKVDLKSARVAHLKPHGQLNARHRLQFPYTDKVLEAGFDFYYHRGIVARTTPRAVCTACAASRAAFVSLTRRLHLVRNNNYILLVQAPGARVSWLICTQFRHGRHRCDGEAG